MPGKSSVKVKTGTTGTKGSGAGSDAGGGTGEDPKEEPTLDDRVKAVSTGFSTFAALDPGVAPEGSPTGTVTLGTGSGSFAPMLAYDVLNQAASGIAEAARLRLQQTFQQPDPEKPVPAALVVLVTEDPSLLRGDVVTEQVHTALKEWTTALDLHAVITSATVAFETATATPPRIGAGGRYLLPPKETPPTGTGQGVAADNTSKDETDETEEGEDEETEETEESEALAALTSVAGAVRNLAQMAAVDFTLTAVTVTPAAGLVARLTAGALGTTTSHHVVLDGFGIVNPAGKTMKRFNDLHAAIRVARTDVAELTATVAASKAQIARLQLEADQYAEDWTAAVKDKDVSDERAEKILEQLNLHRTAIATASLAYAPAQAVIDSTSALVAGAQEDLKALVAVDAAGTSLLLRACSREALHSPADPTAAAAAGQRHITRVLCVEAPHVASDTVTRKSIVGSSGRLGFLSATSTAWVLLNATGGNVIGGGAQLRAAELGYDLESGKTRRTYSSTWSNQVFDKDPLRGIENAFRYAVLGAALGILLLAIAAIVGLVTFWWPNGN